MTARTAREREYWNKIRSGDDARAGLAKYYVIAERRQAAYLDRLRTSAAGGTRMLELGCSDGRVSLELARAGADIVGVDISDVAIANARDAAVDEGLSARFDVGDAANLPYDANSFDVVFASSVIHHLDVPAVAREARRVVRPDGHAIFLEPLGHNPLIGLFRRVTPSARTVDEQPLRAVDVLALQTGWRSSAVHYFDFLTLAAVPLRHRRPFHGVNRALAAADAALFCVPGLWRLAWFALIEVAEPMTAE